MTKNQNNRIGELETELKQRDARIMELTAERDKERKLKEESRGGSDRWHAAFDADHSALGSSDRVVNSSQGQLGESAMRNTAKEGNACPKCGTQLRSVLCARCYGTGKSGERDCKHCGGTGTMIGCPNFRERALFRYASLLLIEGNLPGRQHPLIGCFGLGRLLCRRCRCHTIEPRRSTLLCCRPTFGWRPARCLRHCAALRLWMIVWQSLG